MGDMTKKYGVLVCFCPKLVISGKIVGKHLWILSENLIFFKTQLISNIGVKTKKYRVSVTLWPELAIFGKTVWVTHGF
jgi:hypothetical protein